MHPKFFPQFDWVEMCIEDGMHLQADGLLQYLGYWTFHLLICKRKYFSLEQANKIIKDAPSSVWSDGIPPRPLDKNILKGAKVRPVPERPRW